MKIFGFLVSLGILITSCQKDDTNFLIAEQTGAEKLAINSSNFQGDPVNDFKNYIQNQSIPLLAGAGIANWECSLIEYYPDSIVNVNVPLLNSSGTVANMLVGFKLQAQWKYRIINKKYYEWKFDNTEFLTNKWYYQSLLRDLEELQTNIDSGCQDIPVENRCQNKIICAESASGSTYHILIDCETGSVSIVQTICNSGASGGGTISIGADGTVIWTNPGGNNGSGISITSHDAWNPDEDNGISYPNPNDDDNTGSGGSNNNNSFSCEGSTMTQLINFDETISQLESFITSNNIEGYSAWDLLDYVQPECIESTGFANCMKASLLCTLDDDTDFDCLYSNADVNLILYLQNFEASFPCEANEGETINNIIQDLCSEGSGSFGVEDFENAMESVDKIILSSSISNTCPKYKCIIKNMLNKGALSTSFVESLLKPCEGNSKTDIAFTTSSFSNTGRDPNAMAAAAFIPGKNDKIGIFINTDNCANAPNLEIFETIQHELIHADIKRRLLEDYNFTPVLGATPSYQDAFDQLMLKEYGENPSQDEHDLMLKYYINSAVQSLIDMNGGHGSYNDFAGIVLNGFPQQTLLNAGYNLTTVTSQVIHSYQYISNSSNLINSTLVGC